MVNAHLAFDDRHLVLAIIMLAIIDDIEIFGNVWDGHRISVIELAKKQNSIEIGHL